jgi:mono/diheme cytochrome c family protein
LVKKILKWIGIVLSSLIGLILVALVSIWFIGGAAFVKTYDIQPAAITVPAGPEAIEQGRHIALTRQCTACHGDDLSGTLFINEPSFGVLPAPNLTSGAGGIGKDYADEGWVLAIRHGVSGADHRGLLIMPSEMFTHLNDDDLGALIAYLKSLPPVDNQMPKRDAQFIARMALAFNLLPHVPDLIDHSAAHPSVEPGPTREYGEYLAMSACTACHGENMAGSPWPPGEPSGRFSPNLTPAGELQFWTEEDFITLMRTGDKPGGGRINTDDMPVETLKTLSDDELKALWAYLFSLEPAQPAGQ